MYMVLFVLDNPDRLDEILDAWEAIGVSGVTIVESTGINRRRLARQVGSTFMAGINRLMSSAQEGHYTLFTAVNDEGIVQKCLEAAEAIIGDLNKPETGILTAWPLSFAKGIPDRYE